MLKNTEEKLAGSLTAETTELLPFLHYLLQDFWELGINPDTIIELISKNVHLSQNAKILDLACGKGAVSVKLAQKINVRVKGIDLIPEFIEFAAQKAREFNVGHLCEFAVGDVNEAVETERDFDCVVYGAIGDVLGDMKETLTKLAATVKQGGYVVIDNYDCVAKEEWDALFKAAGLELADAIPADGKGNESETFRLVSDGKLGVPLITKRANELIEKYPDKAVIFEGYVKSQQEEYDCLEEVDSPDDVTWILRRV
ncbi:MAG: class I SAM-dependent methyltransferase [Oscillospiraceae bacterium]|nr:class I SAM-dependent methyltransferase [Oscillospiraceae bacterium]